MKYLFRRDTILATLSVFLVIGLFSLIPVNTHVLNFFYVATADLDYNDLAYLSYKTPGYTPVEDDIVVIDIGDSDRAGIATLLDTVRRSGPAVIGLDVVFGGPRQDTVTDNRLRGIIASTPNLTTAASLAEKKGDEHAPPTFISYFANSAHHNGVANFITPGTLSTVRHFPAFYNEHGRTDTAFAPAVARLYNPEAFARFAERQDGSFFRSNPINEWIYYRRPREGYTVLKKSDVLPDSTGQPHSPAMLRNKIVLIGYLGRDSNDIEDKFFTPLNPRYAGKTKPDMYGVVIHANIISMILDRDYVDDAAKWIDFLVAFLVCWLHMALFIRFYLLNHLWFHLRVKIAQILSLIFFTFLGIGLLYKWHVRFDLLLTLAAIALAVDVLYFYEALVLWLNRRFGYRTFFADRHHHPHHKGRKH